MRIDLGQVFRPAISRRHSRIQLPMRVDQPLRPLLTRTGKRPPFKLPQRRSRSRHRPYRIPRY